MLKEYLYIHNNIFFYLEGDVLVLYSHLGIMKVKNPLIIELFKKQCLLFNFKHNRTLYSFINEIYKLITKGYINKFKIVGVGYRLFYSNNVIVYKLRYSHLIYNVIPLNIAQYKKKKHIKYNTLYSLDKPALDRILHRWLLYRVPNTFTKKGILKWKTKYLFKPIINRTI